MIKHVLRIGTIALTIPLIVFLIATKNRREIFTTPDTQLPFKWNSEEDSVSRWDYQQILHVPGNLCLRDIPERFYRDLPPISCGVAEARVIDGVLHIVGCESGSFGPIGEHTRFVYTAPISLAEVGLQDAEYVDTFCHTNKNVSKYGTNVVRTPTWKYPKGLNVNTPPDVSRPRLVIVIMFDSISFNDSQMYLPKTKSFLRNTPDIHYKEYTRHTTVGQNTIPNLSTAYCNVLENKSNSRIEPNYCGSRSVFDDARDEGYNIHLINITCRDKNLWGLRYMIDENADGVHDYMHDDPEFMCPMPYDFSRGDLHENIPWSADDTKWNFDMIDNKEGNKIDAVCKRGGGGISGKLGIAGAIEVMRNMITHGSERDVIHVDILDGHLPLRDKRHMRGIDTTLVDMFEFMIESGLMHDSVVIMHSDHGSHYEPDLEYDIRAQERAFHNFLDIIAGSKHPITDINELSGMTSAVDIYHTLDYLVGKSRFRDVQIRNAGNWAFNQVVRSVISYNLMKTNVPAERTCVQAGVSIDYFCACFVRTDDIPKIEKRMYNINGQQ